MAQKFADMTEQERRDKFEQWVTGREEKTVKNKAKNSARKVVIDAHKIEYQNLVAAGMKSIKVKPLTDEEAKKVIAAAGEKKVKSKARAAARKEVLNANKPEYDKALAAANKAG